MNRTALIILGSHRSGTSSITRTANLLGAFLPEKLYSSNYGNPKGHWEVQSIFEINEAILLDLSSTHDDILEIDKNWFKSPNSLLFQEKITNFLYSEIGDATFPVIKDPRLCLLFPIWEQALVHMGFDIKIIIPFRNPLEVALSLEKRNAWPVEKGLLIWLKHVMSAELYSRKHQRVFTSYPNFLEDWRSECDRIADHLNIVWPRRNSLATAEAIDDFLDLGLRHHNLALNALNQSPKVTNFIRKVYLTLCDSSQKHIDSNHSQWEELHKEWQFLESNFRNILSAYQQTVGEIARKTKQLSLKDEQLQNLKGENNEQLKLKDEQLKLKDEQLKLKDEQLKKNEHKNLEKIHRIDNLMRYVGAGEQLRIKDEELKKVKQESLQKTHRINSLTRDLSTQVTQRKVLLNFIDKQVQTLNCRFSHRDILRLPKWIKDGDLRSELKLRKYTKLVEDSGLFDAKFYLARNPDVAKSSLDPLLHYLKFGASERRDPSPLFSTSRYLEANPDVLKSGINPLLHYILFGLSENRKLLPEPPDKSQPLKSSESSIARYYGLGTAGRSKVLFVSHEASRTGAPLILLTLVKYFSEQTDFELIVLVNSARGPITEEFEKYANVLTKKDFAPAATPADWVAQILQEIPNPQPMYAFCNTANTVAYSLAFDKANIPVITLVHEFATAYKKEQFLSIYRSSKKIVFPSKFSMKLADEKVPLPAEKAVLIPQGLLDPTFGDGDVIAARGKVRQELKIPKNSLLVLGCGSIDYRKGVDLFVDVALRVNDSVPENQEVHFIWLGEGQHSHGTPLFWALRDLNKSGVADKVHFIGSRSQPNPYFLAADVFILTSREDPFPCVVHEAMASKLPIVCFEDSGGAPEALADGAGVVVPYRDTQALSTEVASLLFSKQRSDQISQLAFERVHKKYSFQKYFENLKFLAFNEATQQEFAPEEVSSKIKVFFFNRDWWISGVNSFTERLIRGLIQEGIDAQLIFPEFNSTQDKIFLPDLPYSFLNLEGKDISVQWEAIIDFLESNSPCIFVPNYDYISSAVSSALSNRVGILGIAHSDDIEHYDHVYRLGRYWNQIIAVSQQIKREILAINPGFSERTSVIHYGVENDRKGTSKTFFDGHRPLRLIYTGRVIQHQKRVLDFIDIVDKLNHTDIIYTLSIVGEGPQLKQLQDRIGQHDHIYFLGRLGAEKVLAELFNSDIFLLTSEFEGLPISLMEAMAQFCVPIAADINSGVPELITSGENGYIVPIGGTKSFCDRICELYSSPDKLAIMAKAASRKICKGGFRTEDMTHSYFEVIYSIYENIKSDNYSRPYALTYKSPFGNILAPAFTYQKR